MSYSVELVFGVIFKSIKINNIFNLYSSIAAKLIYDKNSKIHGKGIFTRLL